MTFGLMISTGCFEDGPLVSTKGISKDVSSIPPTKYPNGTPDSVVEEHLMNHLEFYAQRTPEMSVLSAVYFKRGVSYAEFVSLVEKYELHECNYSAVILSNKLEDSIAGVQLNSSTLYPEQMEAFLIGQYKKSPSLVDMENGIEVYAVRICGEVSSFYSLWKEQPEMIRVVGINGKEDGRRASIGLWHIRKPEDSLVPD